MAKAKTVIGTPYYLSPEIVRSEPYSSSSDIWSLGVILYEMCALKPPFDATSLIALSQKIIKGVYNPIHHMYSNQLKQLLQSCMNLRAD